MVNPLDEYRAKAEFTKKKAKWKYEPFYIVEDNVLTSAELEMIITEAKECNKEDAFRRDNKEYNINFNRIELTKKHKSLSLIEAVLYQQKWWDKAIGIPDIAWTLEQPRFVASITSYNEGDNYPWHTDHNYIFARGLSYTIYITDEGFTGGELCFSMECGDHKMNDLKGEEVWRKITPKAGRMILFPSYIRHGVQPVHLKDKDAPFEKRRLVVNGHLSYHLESAEK